MTEPELHIGVDTGGTFTDFLFVEGERVWVKKVPSTPADPARATIATLVGVDPGRTRVVHGSTVATNTLLERAGARTALVATAGFADVLEIGRQDRPGIYRLDWRPPAPLVPPELRFEVRERIGPGGATIEPLDEDAVRALPEKLIQEGVESVAVCFLFSPENDAHERRAVELLRGAGIPTLGSSEIHPELREYERFSTATVSAFVSPVVDRYLERLANELHPARFLVMESGGGAMAWQRIRGHAVRTVLSGPAGGVVAAEALTRDLPAAAGGVVTFDMGGTSTDVSLVRDGIPHTRRFQIDGLPVAVPVTDVVTVGAGGGSEGWIDAGGALRAGPRSAGADPGPVCYDRGGRVATITDAHVFLGHLPADALLGGEMPLRPAGIEAALRRLGDPVSRSPLEVARGLVRVIEAEMERALRRITQERGVDPRGLTLVPFGGAGGLHAVSLARSLAIPRVWVPPAPGIFSAAGMILAPEVEMTARTVMQPLSGALLGELAVDCRAREAGCRERLSATADPARLTVERELSLRYRGQSHEIDIPWGENDDPRATFEAAYRERYGYEEEDRPVEVTAVRSRLAIATPVRIPRRHLPGRAPGEAKTPVFLEGATKPVPVPRLDRAALEVGTRLSGPAVIEETSSTLWLPEGSALRVEETGLWLEPRPS